MKLAKILILLVGVVIVSLFVLSAVNYASGQIPEYPTLHPTQTPDPNDVADIKAVIEKAYYLEGMAARNFDVSQFPTAFVNDPSVVLSKDHGAFMDRFRTAHTNASISNGFLDYKLAFYGQWKQGAEALGKVEATAKAQNRSISPSEVQGLIEQNAQFVVPPRTDPIYTTPIRFDGFVVDGGRAEVVCDDGADLNRYFLLKTSNGWRIGGWRILQEHA